jgi:glycosyltransferase involved in cell wall biosynthesis
MSNTNKLVSVIMPLYNHENFVGQTIESLIAQTYIFWELIVIDDGSSDESANIVKSFNDDRIKYHFQENLGVKHLAKTINKGLSFAKGNFVTMLPSDDLWIKDRLELQVDYFSNENVVLVFGKQKLIDEKGRVIGFSRSPNDIKAINSGDNGRMLKEYLSWNFISQPTTLIRTSALRKIGGYRQESYMYAEDYPTQLYLALEGEFRYVNKYLACYRMHSGQMTRNHQMQMIETDIRFLHEFFNALSNKIRKDIGYTNKSFDLMLKKRLANAHFTVGRQELFQGKWSAARKHFYKSLFKGNFDRKLKSIVGIIFSFLKFDLEFLTRFSKRMAGYK